MPGLKKIAVLTSGGDAPGMNAAIRAVARRLARGWEVFGVRNGYAGLLGDALEPLLARDVGGIVQCGGTMLGARCPEFAERRDDPAHWKPRAGIHARGGDRRQRLAIGLGQPRARRLRGGGRAFHHRQRSLRQRCEHWLRHRDQHYARSDRPPAHHRVVAPAGFRGGDDGSRLRLYRAHGRHRGRRGSDRAPARSTPVQVAERLRDAYTAR